jgi:ABC-type nitrate/sulfonate/bicarbonate transport system ATPase subunit
MCGVVGYCPQFDALHENLTAAETLTFYGRIRGIPEFKLPSMVAYLIDRLSLGEYANRKAGTYSGGNKRKLSVAIALIGNPPVVFLGTTHKHTPHTTHHTPHTTHHTTHNHNYTHTHKRSGTSDMSHAIRRLSWLVSLLLCFCCVR